MKFNTYILMLLIAMPMVMSLSSCSDEFLAAPAANTFPENQLIKNKQDAQAVLSAAYDGLRTSDGFLTGQLQMISELLGDHLTSNNLQAGDYLSLFNRTSNIFMGPTRSLMSNGSKAVARANNLLRYIDNLTDLTDAEKARMKAECKFLKAICHFELVRIFAQPYGFTGDVNGRSYTNNGHPGVAIHDSWGLDPVNRSTVAQVYQYVINNLRTAANDLPATNGIYANKWAAEGYLAKVYFQMNQFDSAYYYSNHVITAGPVTAIDSVLSTRFSKTGTSESLFNIYCVAAEGASCRFDNLLDMLVGTPQLFLSDDLYNRYTNSQPNDLRYKQWMKKKSLGSAAYIYCTKFANTSDMVIPVIHLTEMKLIRAEAGAETGHLTEAAQDLTEIRHRAGLTQVPTGTSASDLIQIARGEREIEMLFEGNRLQEMRRRAVRDNLTTIFVGTRNCPAFCAGLVCQIPDNELKGNANYESNPQGGCQ